jgi:hypothetical protein
MIEVKYRSNIKLKNIQISFNKNTDDDAKKYMSETTGIIPLVVIKDVLISEEDIIEFKLYNSKFSPCVDITFRDSSGKLKDSSFPLDNEVVGILIRSNSELNMPIRIDFKILVFNPMKNKNDESNVIEYKLYGELNVDELYFSNFKSYKGNSFDVLQKVSKECNLGFATNISNTNDTMVWINPNDKTKDFIEDVVLHSYKDDTSFLWSYIDFYYNLVYFDIENCLNDDISNLQGTNPFVVLSDSKKETLNSLYLSNHPSLKGTNKYINKYDIINSSTEINLELGYKTRVRFYDKTEKNFNTTLLDTISTVGDGTGIVLKDNTDSKIIDNVVGGNYLGKLDRDNVHPNYLYAYHQNSNNLDFLQKIRMTITIKGQMNFNLIRFQKILVKLYDLSNPNKTKKEKSMPIENYDDAMSRDEDKINQRLSGEWLITGINFVYSINNGNYQEITLVKRELSSTYNGKNNE